MTRSRRDLHPQLSLVVAVSENGVIGRNGDLPWRLPEDLKQFKRLTLGHHLVMGRKTYDSIGRLLPGRTTVILTTQPDLVVAGAVMAHSLDELAAAIAGDSQPFVVGGAELYRQTLPFARHLYLTRVHAHLEGDAFFEFDPRPWTLVSSQGFAADSKNEYSFTAEHYQRLEL